MPHLGIDKAGLRQLWRRYNKAKERNDGTIKRVVLWAQQKYNVREDTVFDWLRRIKQGRYNLRKTGDLYIRRKRRKVWFWLYEDDAMVKELTQR